MKAFLMHRDRDFDWQQALPGNAEALIQDLELNTLFEAMAAGDKFLFDVAKRVVLLGAERPETIRYRQDILRDCLKNPAIVRGIYDLATESVKRGKKSFWSASSKYPASILHGSIEALQVLMGMLRKLRDTARENGGRFHSEGFRALFEMIERELSDDYFARVQNHLRELKFRDGVLISAALGKGNKGTDYVLRRAEGRKQGLLERVFGQKERAYTFYVHPRDESGARALSELRDHGINLVANAVGQSTDHILSFFNMLGTELAFYVGCLNLHERLAEKGEPVCFPAPVPAGERRHSFGGLYDVCLTLSVEGRVVGNDVNADGKDLVIITGANRGGKSTFLRSIGLAQLMMQCGMFVPAESFTAEVCDGLFTHYKREEDATMKSGKLDEELGRMSEIADHVRPNSLLLFNESFAATNEREGSELARQIVAALVEKGVKVFFVTHLYDFAHRVYEKGMATAMFLRAGRQADGGRAFKLLEGEPLETSYGEDLYRKVFVSGPGEEGIEKIVLGATEK